MDNVINNTAYISGKTEAVCREPDSPYNEAITRLEAVIERHEITLEQVHARTSIIRGSSDILDRKLELEDRRGGSPVVFYLHSLADRVENMTAALGRLLYELEI